MRTYHSLSGTTSKKYVKKRHVYPSGNNFVHVTLDLKLLKLFSGIFFVSVVKVFVRWEAWVKVPVAIFFSLWELIAEKGLTF